MKRAGAALALGLLVLCAAAPAWAQEGLFGRDTLHGMAEVRWAATDGETGWVDGGFSKTAVAGHGDGWRDKAGPSQAVVEWRPRLGFAASAVVSGQWQADVEPRLDLNEAYLKVKAPPNAFGRISGRAGYFYPPISLEHGGVGWTTTDLISASALNSWVGEEVKVGGAEVSVQHMAGEHEVTATAGVFGWDDTAGTLLSFRGWALHGLRSGVRSEFELPPLTPFLQSRQADETYPSWEIDHRPGWYARLEWRPPAPVVLHAFHYDNRGDRVGVRELQWAWETRFSVVGLTWEPAPDTKVLAQALSGRTWMGYANPETWVNVGYRAAYVMGVRQVGTGAASVRLDAFETSDRTREDLAAANETGWAATAGWRQPLTPWADLLLEAQTVRSKRLGRMLAGDAPKQNEAVLQSALRLHF